MKKTSIKICSQFIHVYYCGFGDLQYILPKVLFEPDYCNVGQYGWNCDIYTEKEKGVVITTGYRNMKGERIPEEIIKKYSKNGKEIYKKYNYCKKGRQAYLNNFENMVDELINKTKY